jgi:excisionase family DNA binding protein
MREFSFLTVSQIVREVQEEGVPRFSRSTFYRMIKRGILPVPARTAGAWRRFSREEVEKYKKLIKKAYGL